MLQRDVLVPWVSWNRRPAASELVPLVTLGATERRDLAPVMTAVGNLIWSGYVDPSQLAEIDRLIGLPFRDVSPG